MIIKDQVIDKAGIPLYKRLMHVTSASQKLTAANIANVSTPGYHGKALDFKKEMEAAVSKKKVAIEVTDKRHINPAGQPKSIKIIESASGENASGVNDIDIDQEMAALAENQILYSYGANMLMRQFNALKTVIRGRR
jgi:flagellar basal-body rod protein FlgB